MDAPSRQYLNPESPWMLVLLATLVSLGPLSVDMYLPAMPLMRDALNSSSGNIQLTLSAYLAGFAIFHLVCGPLADRFGRKPVLQGGMAIFIGACIGCSFASSVEQLIVFRFLQGIGACVGPTLARAVTRDLFGPRRAAKALSLIAMLMALAPAIAPSIGSLMMLVWPWRSIFVFLAVYGATMCLLIHTLLPETLPQRQSLHPVTIFRNFLTLLRAPGFVSIALGSSLVYAAMLTYLSASGFVYIEMLGVPMEYFGLIFLTSVFGYFIGSAASARLSAHFESNRVVLLGGLLSALACLTMLAGSTTWPASIYPLMLPMMLFAVAMGLVLPHAMNLALQPFPHMAGTASALLGFIQMGVSATASGSVGALMNGSPAPMVWLMTALSLLALALIYGASRRLGGA